MSSTINPNNIDTAYPIAGQDNDSQGFRDNFTNISTNLATAKSEIEELQNKGIFKSAVGGAILSNDMAGAEIKDATVVRQRLKVVDYGTVSTGTVNLDASSGTYHKITVTGDINIDFSGFAPTGTYTEFYLELFIDGTPPYVVTMLWPGAIVQEKRIRHFDFVANSFTFSGNPGQTYSYKMHTTDAGSRMILTDLARDHNLTARNIFISSEDALNIDVPNSLLGRPGDVAGMTVEANDKFFVCSDTWDGTTEIWSVYYALRPAPTVATGAAGDSPGMVASDGTYAYFCDGFYDGATSIWKRVAIATW
jgi:hypothetical protein